MKAELWSTSTRWDFFFNVSTLKKVLKLFVKNVRHFFIPERRTDKSLTRFTKKAHVRGCVHFWSWSRFLRRFRSHLARFFKVKSELGPTLDFLRTGFWPPPPSKSFSPFPLSEAQHSIGRRNVKTAAQCVVLDKTFVSLFLDSWIFRPQHECKRGARSSVAAPSASNVPPPSFPVPTGFVQTERHYQPPVSFALLCKQKHYQLVSFVLFSSACKGRGRTETIIIHCFLSETIIHCFLSWSLPSGISFPIVCLSVLKTFFPSSQAFSFLSSSFFPISSPEIQGFLLSISKSLKSKKKV